MRKNRFLAIQKMAEQKKGGHGTGGHSHSHHSHHHGHGSMIPGHGTLSTGHGTLPHSLAGHGTLSHGSLSSHGYDGHRHSHGGVHGGTLQGPILSGDVDHAPRQTVSVAGKPHRSRSSFRRCLVRRSPRRYEPREYGDRRFAVDRRRPKSVTRRTRSSVRANPLKSINGNDYVQWTTNNKKRPRAAALNLKRTRFRTFRFTVRAISVHRRGDVGMARVFTTTRVPRNATTPCQHAVV